ncbi:winged helix-turn-helix transcriptional regulator [Mucilaginibacter sp. X5P1]|uniref:winged helix-turn-helix transcriptional regulator n=1 Tax=Mucilaginibacter sp. X5P1 TaxID=2723088 RepID=UPI001613F464|nr:helix-turn-helix domain-containing protein [Mucilaginibacter sp. X5P1]MBB6136984.1 DNA-binding HxlR family transcriptional regulator [Mucilaginibacter sp. X5P1]
MLKLENKGKYIKASDCPIAATIDVIGGKWKPIIIWLLIQDVKRFGELHRSIPGIALKVLNRQLKELEADSIITRTAYPEVPPRVEYALSEKGKTLTDIMKSLALWSTTNILEPEKAD